MRRIWHRMFGHGESLRWREFNCKCGLIIPSVRLQITDITTGRAAFSRESLLYTDDPNVAHATAGATWYPDVGQGSNDSA